MTTGDRQVLRELARRKAEIAHDPVNAERREAWLNLDCDASPRPMVLAETAGIQDTRRPVNQAELQCEEKKARGIERGDRVGLWAPNCAEWTIVQYATATIGAILVNINPAYRTHELGYVLNQSGTRLLISATSFKTSNYRAIVEEVRHSGPSAGEEASGDAEGAP